jgi:hypothetical protein
MKIENRKGMMVTPEEFETVKTLLKDGVPAKTVRKLTGRSYFTIEFIKRAKTFGLYSETSKKYWDERKKAKNEKVDVKPNEEKTEEKPYVTVNQMIVLLAEMNRNISRMDKNLETLASFVIREVNKAKLEKKGFRIFN